MQVGSSSGYVFKNISRAKHCISPFYYSYAAESLASLIRRLKGKALTKHLRSVLRATAQALSRQANSQAHLTKSAESRREDLIDGLSRLLFFLVRGVQGKLHSSAPAILQALFAMVEDHEDEVLLAIGCEVIHMACEHLKPEESKEMWVLLCGMMEEKDEDKLIRKLKLLNVMIGFK